MERGSDKHASRLDENLKSDTSSMVTGSPVESRATEARQQEGPGDDDAVPDARLHGDRAAPAQTLTYDELEARTELARHLTPSAFPADRERLVESARENQAPGWLIQLLGSLPSGTYPTTEAVWEALGGQRETRA